MLVSHSERLVIALFECINLSYNIMLIQIIVTATTHFSLVIAHACLLKTGTY